MAQFCLSYILLLPIFLDTLHFRNPQLAFYYVNSYRYGVEIAPCQGHVENVDFPKWNQLRNPRLTSLRCVAVRGIHDSRLYGVGRSRPHTPCYLHNLISVDHVFTQCYLQIRDVDPMMF